MEPLAPADLDALADPSEPVLPAADRALLDFERSWWSDLGPKGPWIRAQLGYSPTRYYERLATLLDDPAAYAYDPLTVKRLRRLRDQRRRARFDGNTADPRSR